ncbi:hypothetical protein AB0M28_14240 [Streptomyces sp. NPDC051940]|uniref:hypothetical protein n=1 Tax=Streptomyces sp. NPDC051940 TaxID=3155675 RepID=UPI00342ED33F
MPGTADMYNLTVEDLHTYYVFVGDTSVLVHNESCWQRNFFKVNPNLRGQVWVHHAIERKVLTKYPGLFTADELNGVWNLRGVPKGINSDLHLHTIRLMWNRFYKSHPTATRQQIADYADWIDRTHGYYFTPPRFIQ